MSVENLFGPIYTAGQLGDAVSAHVDLWLPDYLRELERLRGRDEGALPAFKSHRHADRVARFPEDQLPTLVTASAGLSGTPRRLGDGRITATWALGLTAVVKGRDDERARALAEDYAAALRAIAVQQPVVEEGRVRFARWEDEAYAAGPFDKSRSLGYGTVTFSVEVTDAVRWGYGPTAPSDEPHEDPGALPELTEAELSIERRG